MFSLFWVIVYNSEVCGRGGHNAAGARHCFGWRKLPVEKWYLGSLHAPEAGREKDFGRFMKKWDSWVLEAKLFWLDEQQ